MRTEKEKSEYKKNVVFPITLTFEDMNPEDSEYETPESVKFIRDFDSYKV